MSTSYKQASQEGKLVATLHEITSSYLSKEAVLEIDEAYLFAREAHKGQKRRSGTNYIEHPLCATITLANLRQEAVTLKAALLHDTLEDCNTTYEDLKTRFGDTVASLVSGVTKLNRLGLESADKSDNASNIRKMLVAMAKDVRVILVKLADRLHNMQTLKYLDEEQRKRISNETLEIYAPIALRLGIAQIRWQLEDEAFKHLMPTSYRSVSRRIARSRRVREETAKRAVKILSEALSKADIKCEVVGRPKHLYSIYRKMKSYLEVGREFSDIYDLIGLRVIVDSEEEIDCYRVLTRVHRLWRPIPHQFDDYISNPKANLYQALHTAVIGPEGRPLEVQIRNRVMHLHAEEGVASHWSYKGAPTKENDMWFERAVNDLTKTLLSVDQDIKDDTEYVANIKSDIFGGQIFAFTPKGDVVELSVRSTPLDFAYKVHTTLGHSSVGARVNGLVVPLNYRLKNGDIVEIIKSNRPAAPRHEWLDPQHAYLSTNTAKSKVRLWFRTMERTTTIEAGSAILKREKENLGIKEENELIAKGLNYKNLETLLFDLGQGKLTPNKLATDMLIRTYPTIKGTKESTEYTNSALQKLDVSSIHAPRNKKRVPACCAKMAYGSKIAGYITRDKSVSIHEQSCPNLLGALRTHQGAQVFWRATKANDLIKIHIRGSNRLGLIRDVTAALAKEQSSISTIFSDDSSNPTKEEVTVDVGLYVTGPAQLGRVFASLRTVPGVSLIEVSDLDNQK